MVSGKQRASSDLIFGECKTAGRTFQKEGLVFRKVCPGPPPRGSCSFQLSWVPAGPWTLWRKPLESRNPRTGKGPILALLRANYAVLGPAASPTKAAVFPSVKGE